MNRREFVEGFGCGAFAATVAARPLQFRRPVPSADHTLRIAPLKLDLGRGKSVQTTAYNGIVPGPLIRVREGAPVTIEVLNDTDAPELVHWHGLHIAGEVDGVMEEGTPHVPARGRAQYTFTPTPTGTRWYHSHAFAGRDLHRSTYSGQFGFLMIDAANDAARYDQEIFLALHDWNPFISGGDDGFQMVAYNQATINGRMLGEADPIRVREGERVLFRLLNASASEAHWLVLPGHRFTVTAMDGNAVPSPVPVDQLRLEPGERIDAIVEMRAPGVWVLGEPRDDVHKAGLGIVVEYAGRSGPAERVSAAPIASDYLRFGGAARAGDDAVERIPLVFRSAFHGHGAFEGWTINGRSWPRIDPVVLRRGARYRLVMDNQSIEDHPVHLHRHTVELVRVGPQGTSGIRKDVVTVPARTVVEADFTADQSGKSLFHCHLQDHMDAGFMMLFDCP